jgi:hypothetical protein
MIPAIHFCKTTDVDEAAPVPEEKPKVRHSLRHEVAELWSICTLAQSSFLSGNLNKVRNHSLSNLKALLDYAVFYGPQRGGKKKIPVDVPKMIEQWTEWIAKFSTAHSKDQVDRVEFQIDELLGPLLVAPIKQIRQFYQGLVDSLEADKRVPFFVWSMFRAWGKVVIDPAEDKEAIIRLKKKLASDIADLVEEHEHIYIDYHQAMIGALQWRSPEALTEIKEDLKAGAKPRIKGRQSCLFLATKRRGKNHSEHVVML